MIKEKIVEKFKANFNREPLLVASPGRINMIGEHTDYNEGYVMPAAIDKEILCAISPNGSNQCRVIANDLDDEFEFNVNDFSSSEKGWPNYILGVIEQFQQRDLKISGFDCVFGGDIPLGAGLSSSAAMECAFAYSFNTMFGHGLSKLDLVKLSQAAENQFVGVNCGIMDQFASVHGREDQLFRLDCKTLEFEYFSFPLADYSLVLCDSQVKHSLASSEYNTRRKECEEGVAILKKHYAEINSLRDVTIEQLLKHESEFDPVTFKRCKYVVEENDRVLDCCNLLQAGNLKGFGENMFKTHDGLSKDYEVSCKELDFLKDKAVTSGMVIGSRMMGGGFGGCTINIVQKEQREKFINFITDAYNRELGLKLKTYIVEIKDGTGKR